MPLYLRIMQLFSIANPIRGVYVKAVARQGLVALCVYVSGRDAQGRFFVYARILSRKGLEPGLVMG